MNRSQRRAKAKATPAYRRNMTKEDTLKALYKNGITLDDLQRNYEVGLKDGRHEGVEYTIKTVYAASAIALHEVAGWGHIRCTRFLRRMDEIVTTTLTSEEVIEEALQKAGVDIVFKAALSEDRIVEVEA